MKSVALVIGHGPTKDQGAYSKDKRVSELQWNRAFVPIVASELKKLGVEYWVLERRTEKRSPIATINVTGAQACCEFHLNSADGQPSGTEMIYYPGSVKGAKLGRAMQKAAVTILQLPDRGIRTPYAGRGMAFLRDTKMPAIIVETFFICTPGDLQRGTAVRYPLAVAYAQALANLKL